MKTRIVVHIALNAKNERVNTLLHVGGQLIPFRYCSLEDITDRTAMQWIGYGFCTFETIANWKSYVKKRYRAVRFQRVTLIGESNEN